MSVAHEPTGTLEVALAHATKLLASDPALAARQAAEIRKVVPGHPPATLILAQAARARGDLPAALATLERLAATRPDWAAAHYELGLARSASGRGKAAIVVRGSVPALFRERTCSPDAELRAGPLADLQRVGGAVEALRSVARATRGPGARVLSWSARNLKSETDRTRTIVCVVRSVKGLFE